MNATCEVHHISEFLLQSLIPIRAERLKQVSVVVRVFVRGISKQSAIGKY